MTLLCQISPTTCDNLKHFRLTSRQQMKMNQDLVHAVERRNGDTPGALLAGAIKSCLHERRRRGDTLSEAVRNCAGKNGFIRTLAGEAAEKYDLGADLSLTLDLDEKTAGVVSRVTGKRNVSEGTLQDEFRPATLVNEYRTLRDQHLETWTRTIEEPEIAQPLPFSPSDLQTLRNVSPASRRTLLNSLASSRALVDLTRQVHDVERVLESAMQSPHADEEMRRRLTHEKERLSSELRRLVEEHEREKEHRSLLLKVLEEAENDQFRRINPVLQRQARERHFRRNRAAERPVSAACPSNSQDGMESEQAKR